MPDKIIRILQTFYDNPRFKVVDREGKSEFRSQKTGIRQGCPLSPYLFTIVMTVMFHDIHKDDHLNLIPYRPIGAPADEVFYADDTILLSTDPYDRPSTPFYAY